MREDTFIPINAVYILTLITPVSFQSNFLNMSALLCLAIDVNGSEGKIWNF